MKKALIAFGILVGLIVLGGFALSPKYEAMAVIELNATPAEIHKIVGDLETWDKWGPWMKSDPNMKIQRGPVTGVGATQSWESEEGGNGKLVFTDVDPERGIKYDLFFDDYPKSTAEFQYRPKDGRTEVTWVMRGEMPVPVLGGYLALFFQSVISKNFKDGLENVNGMLQTN